MIDLEAVRDRVHALGFIFTGDAVDAVDAMTNMSAPVPAAYVSIAREGAAKNKNSTGRHTQIVSQTLSVLMAVGGQRADGDIRATVEYWKNEVRDSITGWQAPGANTNFDYDSYSIRFMGEGLVWSETLFSCRSLLSK
jgi:hypothetical protein